MTNLAIKANLLSKLFVTFQKERTLLRLMKTLIKGESYYTKYLVLNELSFEIAKGEKVALVGGNGAGKTTLLRILSGIYQASSGELNLFEFPKSFFRFWIGITRELSVLESIHLLSAIYGITTENLQEDTESILEMAELKEHSSTYVKVLSSGQYQRLALSVFFHVKSDFVIFDEGLTYLDAKFIHKCEKYFNDLANSPRTAILTSHDNSFLRKYCTSAMWLEKGRIVMKGAVEEVLKAYEASSEI